MTDRTLKITFVSAALLALFWFLFRRGDGGLIALFSFMWFAVAIHEVEEYILAPALLGEEYYFRTWAYSAGYDISVQQSFVVNVLAGYPVAIAAGLLGPIVPEFALFFIAGILLINACWHVGLSFGRLQYSPGSITSAVIFVPYTYLCFEAAIAHRGTAAYAVIAYLLGFSLHYVLFRFMVSKSPHHFQMQRP